MFDSCDIISIIVHFPGQCKFTLRCLKKGLIIKSNFQMIVISIILYHSFYYPIFQLSTQSGSIAPVERKSSVGNDFISVSVKPHFRLKVSVMILLFHSSAYYTRARQKQNKISLTVVYS